MKLFALLLALLLLMTSAASADAPQPADTPAPYERPACVPLDEVTLPGAGAPFTVEGDIGIAIGDAWYPALRGFEALREALGEPLDVVLTDSLIHTEHYDKEFVYDFGSVYTHPVDGVDIWYELYVAAGELSTARGIGVGSTVEQMLAAHGSEYFTRDANEYVYSLAGREQEYATPMVALRVDGSRVVSFSVYYPVFDE